MSIELDGVATPRAIGPELSALGKRIEMLRIERGISKQHLARFAGTSRQQLWRVMTGKSDLTGALGDRLADALQVDRLSLASSGIAPLPSLSLGESSVTSVDAQDEGTSAIEQYLASAEAIDATLRSMPSGDAGRRLKRGFLDALEDAAHARRIPLSEHVFELRRRVLNSEL